MRKSKKLVILFDGSCHFCTATAELLRVLDWRPGLHCLPSRAPGIPQAYGLTVTQCERVVWAISPDGSSSQGAQAVSAALDAIVGLPLFRALYQVPSIRPIEEKYKDERQPGSDSHGRRDCPQGSHWRRKRQLEHKEDEHYGS